MDELKKAGDKGLTFTELMKKTGLSRDVVSRCLRYLKEQGMVEKRGGRYGPWVLRPRVLPLLDEVEVWLEKLDSLDEELFEVMLKRLSEIKGEVKTEECAKLAEKVAGKLEEWRDDYEKLEKALSVVELLPEKSLKSLKPLLKSILEEFLRKCPRKYVVEGSTLIAYEILNRGPSQLEKLLGPRLGKTGDPTRYPNVFLKALELLCRVLRGEEKFQALMQLLREALNANIMPGGRDVRAWILMHVEDRRKLLKTLIEMFQREEDPALKESIKEILEHFDNFARRC